VYRDLLPSKVHRASHPDLCVGTITIDAELLAGADLADGEQVQVVDVDSGARLVTCAVAGPPGSGVVGLHGTATALVSPGDLLIIMAARLVQDRARPGFAARLAHVDPRELPGPAAARSHGW
jgi:aspartate 1-decarboxylase